MRTKDWSSCVGQTFNHLMVLEMVDNKNCLAKCVCGKEIIELASLIGRGKVRSCAEDLCISPKGNSILGPSIVGKKYGRLTVLSIKRVPSNKRYRAGKEIDRTDLVATCLCACGTQKDLRAADIVHGNTTSCGCARALSHNIQKEGDLRKCKGRCEQLKTLNDQNFPRRDKDKQKHLWRWVCFDCRRVPPLTPEELSALEAYRVERKIWTRLHSNTSRSIRYYLNKDGNKKEYKTEDFLPYTMAELKAHLESLWEPWMNWENQGSYSPSKWKDGDMSTWRWQVDHIKPASEFHYTKPEDQDCVDCWALSNLRPLSAKENMLDGTSRSRHLVKDYGNKYNVKRGLK